VGYTGIRVRGDAHSLNVTINGFHDSESHGTYWVNMPDFASSLESLQLQRGRNFNKRAGAFGASLNMLTDSYSKKWKSLIFGVLIPKNIPLSLVRV
jgi:iron complex outermembrane receptor protein